MNKITLVLLMLLGPIVSWGMERAQGDCTQGGKVVVTQGLNSSTRVMQSYVNLTGNTPTSGCTVNVYFTGTTSPATIYSNNNGTPLANPFTADATGHWFFYGEGRFDITMSGAGIIAPLTIGDVKLQDFVSVADYGAAGTGEDATSAFTQAVASGRDVYVPAGSYGISSTISITTLGQKIYGEGANLTKIYKYANHPVFFINADFASIQNLSEFGNYDQFSQLQRPASAPGFVDTTDGIQVGVAGSNHPYQWQLYEVWAWDNGENGLGWIDGPSPILNGVWLEYNARWGMWVNQANYMGGTASDTDHMNVEHMEVTYNGRGTYTTGGGALIQGGGHSVANIKAFGNWGDGVNINAASGTYNVWSELNGKGNSGIPAWASSTAYSAGAMVRSGPSLGQGYVYVTIAGGTSGASIPSCTSGTCSDGGVTWQFRDGIGVIEQAGNFQANVVNLLWLNTEDGYSVAGTNVIQGLSRSAGPSQPSHNIVTTNSLRVDRQMDFAKVGATDGSFNSLNLQVLPGGTNYQYQLTPTQTSAGSIVTQVQLGDVTGNNGQTIIDGSGFGAIQNMPVGRYISPVLANIDLAGIYTTQADVYRIDLTTGSTTFYLASGGIGAEPGKIITVVKVDSTANFLNISTNGPGTILNNPSSYVTISQQWQARTFMLLDSSGNWIELSNQYPTYYQNDQQTTFSSLSTPAVPISVYCSDCTVAPTCAGSGTGAWAFRSLAGGAHWTCPF